MAGLRKVEDDYEPPFDSRAEVGKVKSPRKVTSFLLPKGTHCDTFECVKFFQWDPEKSDALRLDRGISFEEIIFHIGRGDLLDILEHPNQARYRGQRIFVVNVDGYAYLVPFVENDVEIFLKTIIPSRKATRRYLKGES